MSEAPRTKRVWQLSSGMLLVVAIVFSALAVGGGQSLMLSLYRNRDGVVVREASRYPDAEPLVVAVGKTAGGPAEWESYAHVLSRLERDLRRPVRVRYLSSRAQAVDEIRNGTSDLAFVATVRYLELVSTNDATLVAAPVLRGERHDAAVIVVSAASDVTELEGLRGRSILLSDPLSLGGYSYVQWLFGQREETPEEFFGDVVVGEAQDRNLAAVLAGEADAAGVNRSSLATWPEDSFRIVSESPTYGMPPLVASTELPDDVVEAVRTSVTAWQPDARSRASRSLQGFLVTSDDAYEFARVLARYSEQTVDLAGTSLRHGRR